MSRRRSVGFALLAFAACARPFDADEVALAPGLEADAQGASDAASDTPRPPVAWIDVTTQHGDPGRTGANLAERCVRPANVAKLAEARRFTVQGQVYAQPLVAARLLVVATTANELAAFDLDRDDPTPKWKLGPEVLGTPANVVRNVSGPLGILSTPAIDVANDRLFAIARSCPTSSSLLGCKHRLFAVRLSSGAVIDDVEVAPPGFDPDWQWNRPGLLLQNGLVYSAWGVGQSGNQHEEDIAYHGWVIAHRADDLHAPPRVHDVSEHGRGAGIWQAGAGVAGDGEAIYVTTGNSIRDEPVKSPSDFPAAPVDAENSVVRLRFDATSDAIERATYWDPRPYKDDGNVFQYMERWDIDFSSAGAALIPGSDDLVVGSKGGILYLLDKKTLAPLQAPLSPFHEPPLASGHSLYIYFYGGGPQLLGAPVVANGAVYVWPRFDRLTRLHHDRAQRTLAVERQGDVVASEGGGMLALTADGEKDGLVWAVVPASAAGGAKADIIAFDATTLARLWSSSIDGYAKFTCPTVSAGHVFVASWRFDGTTDVIEYAAPSCD